MSIRVPMFASVAVALAIGLIAAPSSEAQNREQAMAAPGAASSRTLTAPVKVATIQVFSADDRILADHGAAYDFQGNPVDRYGYVIAVPESRGIREVFVSLDR